MPLFTHQEHKIWRNSQISKLKHRISELKRDTDVIQDKFNKKNKLSCHASPKTINLQALILTLKKIEELLKNKKIYLTMEYELVLQGHDVYPSRFTFLPIFYVILTIILLCYHGIFNNIQIHLVSMLLSYIYYDFLSGVLHVVLDDPNNLNGWRSIAVLKPCLEFQWHHIIPNDISSRSLLHVCSDLNVLVISLFVVYFILMQGYKTSIGASLMAFKLYFAYFGQFSHRASHSAILANNGFINFLQRYNICLSPDVHRVHHQVFNDNYCIGNGLWNPVISKMRQFTKNSTIWLLTLITLIVVDFPIFNFVLSSVF